MEQKILYSIDRFENDMAVLVDEEGDSLCVAVSQLPASVRSGDVLVRQKDTYRYDPDETEMRRTHIRSLQEKLRRKNG